MYFSGCVKIINNTFVIFLQCISELINTERIFKEILKEIKQESSDTLCPYCCVSLFRLCSFG